jgi:hypothetical protein
LFSLPVRPELLWEALSAGYWADVVEKILRDNSAHNIGGVSALFALLADYSCRRISRGFFPALTELSIKSEIHSGTK